MTRKVTEEEAARALRAADACVMLFAKAGLIKAEAYAASLILAESARLYAAGKDAAAYEAELRAFAAAVEIPDRLVQEEQEEMAKMAAEGADA